MTENKKKPVKSIRLGNMEAAVWPNRAKTGEVYFSFTFQKSYKNQQTGEWAQTAFLNRGDLADLAVLAMKLCMEETGPRKRAENGQTSAERSSPAQYDAQEDVKDDDVPF